MSTSPALSVRRADSRFLLPEWPASARVLGDLPGWREALRAGQLLDAPEGPVDLVVAPAALAAMAARGRPRSLLLSGRPGRGSWRSGYTPQRIVALPGVFDPRALVPRRHRRALSYVLSSWLPGRSHRSRLRNQVGAGLARVGGLPPVLPEICLATTARGAAPAILTGAIRAGLVPSSEHVQWFLDAQSGADSKRLGLFVFAGRSPRPTHLLKLDRRPGSSESARRETAGLELVGRAGGVVAAHGPTPLGRFEVHDHVVLVQTVCPGSTLSLLLLGPASRGEKAAAVEQVVSWLRRVAKDTASRDVRPDSRMQESSAIEVPRVFAHGDLAPGNVLVASGQFSVVDWEHADPSSFPLWDLLYFALHVLPLLDGEGEDPSGDYLERLFLGQAPSSARLFGWVRSLRQDLGLSDAVVGQLATACWAHYADLVEGLRRALVLGGAPALPALPVERLARLWSEQPRLRGDWRAWS